MEEEILWQGSRSQITNIGKYLLAALACAGIIIVGAVFVLPILWLACAIPLAWAVWLWVSTKSESFTLTTERLRLRSGVFNQVFDEVELYRIKDISFSRSAVQRIYGLGTVTLLTSDRGQENCLIDSVRSSEELREFLRTQVEIIRDRKRVREVDFQDDLHAHGDGG